MGLISKLKSMFSKNIDCSAELNDNLVHFFTTSGRKVRLGTSIVVKDGYSAVIVCKDRVTDVLTEGKHKLDNSTIPVTFKTMKLYKIDEHGNSPETFKCDFYFVNKGFLHNFAFTSDRPFYRKKDPLGRVEAYCEGSATINVDSPAKLITYLLVDHAYIKDKTATNEISLEIGNMVNKKLEKIDLTFEQILKNGKYVNEFINADIISSMEYMGINVCNIVVDSINMSSKLQKKVGISQQTNAITSPELQSNMQFNQVEVGGRGVQMDLNGEISLGDAPFIQETGAVQPINEVNEHSVYKTCAFCGQTIKNTARFCEYCGNRQ